MHSAASPMLASAVQSAASMRLAILVFEWVSNRCHEHIAVTHAFELHLTRSRNVAICYWSGVCSLDILSECYRTCLEMFSKCSRSYRTMFEMFSNSVRNVLEVFSKCSRNVLEMFSKCSRIVLEMFSKCSRDVLEMCSNCV